MVASRCEELVTESVIDLIMVVIHDRRALQLCAKSRHMQCSKFGEDSTPCRRGRAAWMTRPRPNEQFARRADNQARAMAAIAVGEREEWTAPQRVKPVHSGVLHVLSGWSCRKARTARAARNGTAFFAVAPRERPASAHSPRTGLTRKVKICSAKSLRRSSQEFTVPAPAGCPARSPSWLASPLLASRFVAASCHVCASCKRELRSSSELAFAAARRHSSARRIDAQRIGSHRRQRSHPQRADLAAAGGCRRPKPVYLCGKIA